MFKSALECWVAATMAELQFAQDILRCDACPRSGERNAATIVCKSCRKHLCQSCVPMHVVSSRTEHVVVELGTNYRTARTLAPATVVHTVNSGFKPASRVVKTTDGFLWTSADMNVVKRIDMQGVVMETHTTGSIHAPFDIAINKTNELLFTVMAAKTLNVVRNQTVVQLVRFSEGWTPRGVCSTARNEILVAMFKTGASDKVVRYSGVTATQEISHDSSGRFLFQDASFVCENGNEDVCVSDMDARCVVVVQSTGIPRYKYSGRSQSRFEPGSLACNRQRHILISDKCQNCVHIIDEDGSFLLLVGKSLIRRPVGVCVDEEDTLYVTERVSGEIKAVKYLSG